jgi:predicted ester cyclase
MSQENNKVAIRRFYDEAINQKKLAVIEELFGASYVSHDLPTDPTELKHFINGFHLAFPDGQIIIEQMIAEGDTVAARLTFHGTQIGQFQDIAPTGKTVTVPALDMYRLSEGKIVEHWGGPNQLRLLQQLGAIPSME